MSEHTTHIPEVRKLQRSQSDRMIAGVSGGLARYFEIHPAVFRVGFVVLTLLGGAGILIYVAAWLVIPEEGAEDSIAAAELKKHRGHPRRLLGFALLGAVALAVLSSIHLWPSPGNFWVLAALLVAVLAWWRGRVVLGIVAALLVVLVAGLLLAIRVPVFSGVGDRSYDTLHSKYTLGIGKLTLDFNDLQLPKGQTFVKANVGIGELHVIAPANATLDVDAHAQAGNVVVLDRKNDGTHVNARVVDRTGSGRVLVLDLHTGLGKVAVERG